MAFTVLGTGKRRCKAYQSGYDMFPVISREAATKNLKAVAKPYLFHRKPKFKPTFSTAFSNAIKQ